VDDDEIMEVAAELGRASWCCLALLFGFCFGGIAIVVVGVVVASVESTGAVVGLVLTLAVAAAAVVVVVKGALVVLVGSAVVVRLVAGTIFEVTG
jgi:hypothetical protein